ncbi:MAG: hypothetical protein IT329_02610 [Caldilineaceae bacterium]|nr:hypothetical protein [Caldilineaceae bacterium]
MHWDRNQGSRLAAGPRHGYSRLPALLILAALAWAAPREAQAAAPAAPAAPIVITNCATDTDLRSALGTAGAVEITFDCGPGSHTIPIGAYMQVVDTKTVNGANRITLDGGGTAALLQVFATANLEARNLTLSNGRFNGAHPIENFGALTLINVEVREHVVSGGGTVGNSGQLTVRDSRFMSNTATVNATFDADGAAIRNDGGVVEVIGSHFEDNVTTGTSGLGGAIANLNGQMTIDDSTFYHNAAFDGGALFVQTGTAVTITNSSFISNSANYGGAIESWGQTDITNGVLRENVASGGDGGAIWMVNGDLDIAYTTIADNRANTSGGGISCYANTLSVIFSTISGNRAGPAGSKHGGGIYSGCNLNLTNSTLHANEAPFGGGGGVYQTGNGNTATIGVVTLSDNRALFGAGVYNEGSSTTSVLTLQNTLLVNNVTGNCDGGGITSQGYNLSSDNNCSALTQTGDQQGLATLALGVLKNNGGPTLTRLPLGGSPAIDAIPAAQCAFSTDQRGFTRPGTPGTNCDVGAVEVQPSDLLTKVYIPVALND